MVAVVPGQQFQPLGSPQVAAATMSPHLHNPWSAAPVQPPVLSPAGDASVTASAGQVSDAEYWLNSTASQIDPFAAAPNVGGKPTTHRPQRIVNGSAEFRLSGQTSPCVTTALATVHHSSPVTTSDRHPSSFNSTPVRVVEPTAAGRQAAAATIHAVNASRPLIASSSGVRPTDTQPFDPFDSAFDSAWAAKTNNRSMVSAPPVNNPFQSSVPAFEVKL